MRNVDAKNDSAYSLHVAPTSWAARRKSGEPSNDGRATASAIHVVDVERHLHDQSNVRGSLSYADIEELLHTELVARLGCHAESRTYVVPVTYVYDGDALFVQSADGLKVRMMRQNPTVCVEVDRIDDLANWRSVIAWGRFETLHGVDAAAAFVRLRERLRSLVVSETTPAADTLTEGERRLPSGNGHASIYRIHLFEKTGRFERR